MADELTPENKAIVARHRSPPAGDPAISIRPADLNRMLDAARAQGPGEAISDERAREFVEAAYTPPTPLARELMDKFKASYGPGEAVAWRVKDFADSWIYYGCEWSARDDAERMGLSVIEPLYAATPTREA